MTLDGVMEDPGGGEGTARGVWSFQFWNEDAAKFKFDELVVREYFAEYETEIKKTIHKA